MGVRVVGTASEVNHEVVRRYGGVPRDVRRGLEQRSRDAAADLPGGAVVAGLDCVGTDEALDVSLALVAKDRVVTIAAFERAEAEGIRAIAGRCPRARPNRDGVRVEQVRLAREGRLEVPMPAPTPLTQAVEAAEFLASQHPGGKIALVP